ncbi:MAG: YihY family inner membrane protein [Oceanicoccus sp.]|uniref:YihY family inner membrane protein n=1 Tax=Oceanicoccus sp. TaxID=2691044 RepID=UPI00263187C5|nr:YihY family inner membrane protein [Oceanicoccus sp.]MCP3909312.1 YihY family inner membrane protein [Oceanicoccus sp.]MDG1772267.1 YihY family inner membrane protein [Oceanicoccus sp.]
MRIPSLQDILKLVRYVQKRYVADGCSHSAAALTYMSLFALVPLLTVMYAILSAVPAFQEVGAQIQALIFDNFVPATGAEVENYLVQFSDKARKLTGVGIAFLGVTAILMLKNIEKTFNAIWKTRENRHGLSSFLLYWAILSLGPIFIGLAIGISTYLASLAVMFDNVDKIGIGQHLLRLMPYFLTSAAFTLLFAAVPNCRVPIKHALIGGLITALVFEVAKQLFTGIVSNTSYQTIYGTFAAIPLFLLWIYLSWLIVLAGAELVYAISGFNSLDDDNYSDMVMTLSVIELLWQKHQQGKTVSEQHLLQRPWLFDRHSISAERWTPLRDKLFKGGLLRNAEAGHFILGRDLNNFTLWDLIQLMGKAPETRTDTNSPAPLWFQRCAEQIEAAKQNNLVMLNTPLATLFTDTTDDE